MSRVPHYYFLKAGLPQRLAVQTPTPDRFKKWHDCSNVLGMVPYLFTYFLTAEIQNGFSVPYHLLWFKWID